MTKIVFMVTAGLCFALGCAVGEEPEASEDSFETSSAEMKEHSHPAGASECLLGDGLYCGGNGVDGAINVLYRCAGGTVRSEELCNVPADRTLSSCERMPDGQNDRCRSGGQAPTTGSSTSSSGASKPPAAQAPKPAEPAATTPAAISPGKRKIYTGSACGPNLSEQARIVIKNVCNAKRGMWFSWNDGVERYQGFDAGESRTFQILGAKGQNITHATINTNVLDCYQLVDNDSSCR